MWSNLTISQWQQIQLALSKTEGLDDIDHPVLKWLNILPILTGKSKDEYRQMMISDLLAEARQYDWLSVLPSSTVKSAVTIQGEKYVCDMDIRKICADQFITLSELTKDQEQITQNLHRIMAVFFRKAGKKWSGNNFNDRGELFKEHMTMDIAYPLQLFFCTLLEASLPHVRASLPQQESRRRGFPSIGAGISSWKKWQEALRIGKKLVK